MTNEVRNQTPSEAGRSEASGLAGPSGARRMAKGGLPWLE